MAECGLLQVWSTTNAKTDRKATAPVPAGILGSECIRAADQCACRLVLRPLTPSARDVGWSPPIAKPGDAAANRPFAISTAAKPSPTTPFAIEVAKRGHPETAHLRE
jgi:hypothetical protein